MEPIELAGCVILDDYGRILLLHRSRGDHEQWELPGGKVEEGEDPEETAMRELREELDLEVQLTKLLGSDTFEQDEDVYEYHWFQAEIVKGEPTVLETDSFDDVDYFELDDLPTLSLSLNMLVLYPKILSGEVSLEV